MSDFPARRYPLHDSANATPPRLTAISTLRLRVTCTTISRPVMGNSVGSPEPTENVPYSVQPVGLLRKCSTIAQEEALSELRSVPEPITPARVVAVLGWSECIARRWIEKFQARGYLVASRDGRRWSKEARTA